MESKSRRLNYPCLACRATRLTQGCRRSVNTGRKMVGKPPKAIPIRSLWFDRQGRGRMDWLAAPWEVGLMSLDTNWLDQDLALDFGVVDSSLRQIHRTCRPPSQTRTDRARAVAGKSLLDNSRSSREGARSEQFQGLQADRIHGGFVRTEEETEPQSGNPASPPIPHTSQLIQSPTRRKTSLMHPTAKAGIRKTITRRNPPRDRIHPRRPPRIWECFICLGGHGIISQTAGF
jgi:hypothetical protein